EVPVLGGPDDVQAARLVAGAGADAGDVGAGLGGVDLDPPVGGVARLRSLAAEAAAVGGDELEAVDALVGQVDGDRVAALGVLADLVPRLAAIAGGVDFHLADAAGADVLDGVVEQHLRGGDKLQRRRGGLTSQRAGSGIQFGQR